MKSFLICVVTLLFISLAPVLTSAQATPQPPYDFKALLHRTLINAKEHPYKMIQVYTTVPDRSWYGRLGEVGDDYFCISLDGSVNHTGWVCFPDDKVIAIWLTDADH
jgi:hypothetical protein